MRTPVHWTPPSDRQRFREQEIILEDGRPHGAAMDEWQRQDFLALDDPSINMRILRDPAVTARRGTRARSA